MFVKRLIIIFFTFYSVVIQAIFFPSIFADPKIAKRVDQQKHLDREFSNFKEENHIIFICVRRIIYKQNPDAWRELKKRFKDTNSSDDRQEVLNAMVAWIVNSSNKLISRNCLDEFMQQQKSKKMWLVRYCSYCPEYQKKVIGNIQDFELFKKTYLDPGLKDRRS